MRLTLCLYDKLLFIEFMRTSAVPDKIWAQLSFCLLAVCSSAFGYIWIISILLTCFRYNLIGLTWIIVAKHGT